MTVSDPNTSTKKHKKHKKAKSSRDGTAEQTEVPVAEDIITDMKKKQKSTDSQSIPDQPLGEKAVKKKQKAAGDEPIVKDPTDDVKTVSNNKSHHKEKKRKRTQETKEDQTQLKKRVKTEESAQETDSNTKQNMKTAAEKKKRKKKRKEKDNSEKLTSFLVQPQDDSSNAQASVMEHEETEIQPDASSISDNKVPKKKKKPKDIQKQENAESVDEPEKPSAKDLAKSYLKLWKKDKSNWSFKKVRQIWLIKHLYDAESINKKYFKYLLQYLEESKGAVRSRLIENAQSIYESSSNDADGEDVPDPVKVERARMIIQMLTE